MYKLSTHLTCVFVFWHIYSWYIIGVNEESQAKEIIQRNNSGWYNQT